LARQLTTRPADSGGEDYQKAAALFLEGRMDEALEILSEERLKQQEKDAKKQLEDAKKRQDDTLHSWLLRGQLLAVKFDFDGASRAYGEAVKFVLDSFDAWFAYSLFHQEQVRFREAREGYEKALCLARASGKDEDVAMTLNNLGNLHRNENRMAEARQAFEEALKIHRKLAQKNPDVYLPDVAMTLNNLGVLHLNENRMTEARQAYEESLKIRRKLAEKNPDVYLPKVAVTLNNLGNLHLAEKRMADARAAYEEALSLSIYRTFAEVAPATYEPHVRLVQGNLDTLSSDTERKP
jgi:tetratricopeptide (TPR) repeat protein